MRTAILALGLGLLACSTTHVVEPPAVDSETHFLTLCASSCSDGLSCVCGVCTRACEEASECGELSDDASCSAPRAGDKRACGNMAPAAVCDVECGEDADCTEVGSDHRCEQGVCRAGPLASDACPARSAPDCGDGEHLRTDTDEDGCPNPVCAADDVCTLPLQTAPICFADGTAYTFVAERGRCERASYGGCNATENNFESAQGCWDTCEEDNLFASCLEVWERLEPGEESLGVNADHAIARLEGTHRAEMEFPGGETSALTLTLSDAIAYRVRTASNPNYALENIPQPCEDSVQLEATATFETEDGSFNEQWPRLRFSVMPDGTASAEIHVKRPGAPSNDLENATLRGRYVPDLEPDTCDLFMAISIVLRREVFRGEISFLIAHAACEDVVGTTGVGQGSPIGPMWQAIDETDSACEGAQCCELLSVRECGVDDRCQLIEGRRLNEADPNNVCVDMGFAGCMGADMGCPLEGTQARDPQGVCWFFDNGCQPIDFTEVGAGDPTCNANIRVEVPTCP